MGIESSNSANVLFLLRILLSFSFQDVFGAESTWKVALEDTINVGAGLISGYFNSGDDISIETLKSPVMSLQSDYESKTPLILLLLRYGWTLLA
jgi:hypothetical protein